MCNEKGKSREQWKREAPVVGETQGFRGRDGWRWRRERGLQQNASLSSKIRLGPLQRVCSHVCTLVCFCPVGINTLQSHCVRRWTPPRWPVPTNTLPYFLLCPPNLHVTVRSSFSPAFLTSALICLFHNDWGCRGTTLTAPSSIPSWCALSVLHW